LSRRTSAWIATLCLTGGALLLLFANGSRSGERRAPTNPPDTTAGRRHAVPITSAPDDRAARPVHSSRALRRELAPEHELPGHVLRHRIRGPLAAARGFLAGYLARDDALVPYSEGRLLATLIPGARFVPLEGRNHVLLADDPAWPTFRDELRTFLRAAEPEPLAELQGLSNRELEVLELVAAGLSNEEIASRLYVSVRTVERHLSNIYAKLRVSGKAARAAAAVQFARLRESWARRGPSVGRSRQQAWASKPATGGLTGKSRYPQLSRHTQSRPSRRTGGRARGRHHRAHLARSRNSPGQTMSVCDSVDS
jgi:DNA-binding CsgD family transcriptional regulator